MTIHETDRFLTLLDLLTAEEGSAVTIVHDNPDFDGENCTILVEHDFGHQNQYFGATRLECLEKAYAASKEREAAT